MERRPVSSEHLWCLAAKQMKLGTQLGRQEEEKPRAGLFSPRLLSLLINVLHCSCVLCVFLWVCTHEHTQMCVEVRG